MEKFENIGIRFKEHLKHKGLGVNKTAKILDFSGSQISNINRGKKFGSDKLFKILNVFNDLNPDWLILGIGEMLREHEQGKINHKDKYIIELQKDKINALEKEVERLKKKMRSE